MDTEKQIRQLFEIILEEVKSNPKLSKKVSDLFKVKPSKPSNPKRKNKRAPAILDPISLIEKDEKELRDELSRLNTDQLKDIVSEYGMDPSKLVMKWKKAERIINHIVETASSRSKKGNAFRNVAK